MSPMPTREPGEQRGARAPGRAGRVLEEPPSARYATGTTGSSRAGSVARPFAAAGISAALGSVAVFVVGAIFASTVGLVFVSGVMGAAIGLALASAAAPPDGPPALRRPTATWLAIGLAVTAVIVADVATWLFALREGGTLGLLDYLFTTFGPFVPGLLIVAALGATWGVSSGPIKRV